MINVALIGPGRVGLMYLDIVSSFSDCKISGVLCSNENTCTAIKSKFGCPVFTPDDIDLFFECRPDVVIIASPEWTHARYLEACMNENVSVIVEKPLVAEWAEFERLRTKLKAYSRPILPCFTTRFDTRFERLQSEIRTRKQSHTLIWSQRDADSLAVRRVEGKIPLTYWIVCHDFDLIRYLTNREVVRVKALSGVRNGHMVDDYFVIQLSLDCGGSAIVTSSWCFPPDSLTRSFSFRYSSDELIAEVDDAGYLIKAVGRETPAKQVQEPVVDESDFLEASKRMIRSFIDTCVLGTDNRVNVRDAISALAISEACNRSLIENREVAINEVLL
jgi:predicted dehydrogenase